MYVWCVQRGALSVLYDSPHVIPLQYGLSVNLELVLFSYAGSQLVFCHWPLSAGITGLRGITPGLLCGYLHPVLGSLHRIQGKFFFFLGILSVVFLSDM